MKRVSSRTLICEPPEPQQTGYPAIVNGHCQTQGFGFQGLGVLRVRLGWIDVINEL